MACILLRAFTAYPATVADSLKKAIEKATSDTVRINLNCELSQEYSNKGYYQLGEKYAYEALDLSQHAGYKRGMANAYYYLGISFSRRSQLDKAIECFMQAIRLYRELGNKNGLAFATMLVGVVHYEHGDYIKAKENYEQALSVFSSLGNTGGIANCEANLAEVYALMGQYDKAIEYSTRSYTSFKKLNSPHGVAVSADATASFFVHKAAEAMKSGRKEEAAELYRKATGLYRENIAIYRAIQMPDELSDAYTALAKAYITLREFPAAAAYLDSANALAASRDMLGPRKNVTYGYYLMSLARGDSSGALRYFLKYTELKDSIYDHAKSNRIEQMNVEMKEFEKQKEIDLLRKDKEKQQILLWGGVITVLLLIGIVLIITRRYNEKKKINAELSEKNALIGQKNKEILDSITYARRIQRALITPESYIGRHLDRLNKS